MKLQLTALLPSKAANIVSVILIVVITFAIYIHTLNSSFHFDDEGTVTNTKFIRKLKNVFTKYNERPVLTFTFALNYYFGKLNPFGYHLLNTILHSLCSVLLFYIVLFTLRLPLFQEQFRERSLRIAFFSALIFATHPIRAESVIYISSRSAILCTFFYFSALLCFIVSVYKTHLKNILYILAIIFTLLATGSKEIATTLPFIILLYDYMFLSNRQVAEINKRWKLYLFLFSTILLSIYLVVTGYSHQAYGRTSGFGIIHITPLNYLFTEFSVLLFYLRLLIFPFPGDINLDYDWPYAKGLFEYPTFFSFLVLLAILLITKKIFKSKPLYAFCIIWFFLTSAPESSFNPLKDVIFLHRNYLPSLGPILLFVIGMDNFFKYVGKKLKIKFEKYSDTTIEKHE